MNGTEKGICYLCLQETNFSRTPKDPTRSVVLDFLSGTACLVLTSGALVLSLFAFISVSGRLL